MTEAAAAMRDARRRLELAGVPDPGRDVSALLDAAGAGSDLQLSPEVAARFERMVARRIRREPVSHIVGRRAFWMHDFIVSGDVLDPRPETETVVEAAIARPADRVLDLGTGSGCILLSILHEMPHAIGLGTDTSEAALRIAARNAALVGVADRVSWQQADWLRGVAGRFDLVVSNPPYIAAKEMGDLAPELRLWEPEAALTPGGDGLDAYRAIAGSVADHLAPDGRLLLEVGHSQAADVSAILRGAGFEKIAVLPDLGGRDRVVSAEKCRDGARISL